jgi:hypothetical protein
VDNQRHISIREYLVGLGIPALFFAVVFPMTGYLNFYIGVIGSGVIVIWFLIDWIYLSRGLSFISRSLGIIICLGVGAFILWIALRPAPLGILIVRGPGNYPENTDIAGIKWKDNFSDATCIYQTKEIMII